LRLFSPAGATPVEFLRIRSNILHRAELVASPIAGVAEGSRAPYRRLHIGTAITLLICGTSTYTRRDRASQFDAAFVFGLGCVERGRQRQTGCEQVEDGSHLQARAEIAMGDEPDREREGREGGQ
jgi:hypothetical protein